jgi:hypothetical protein
MTTKLKQFTIGLAAIISTGSCTEFLDIVPDSELTEEMMYYMKEDAWNALAKCYNFLPSEGQVDNTTIMLGDEYMTSVQANLNNWYPAMSIMRGKQSPAGAYLGYWQGSSGATDLYQGIRVCNIFLNKISLTSDLTPTERADWAAQVKFLKAYYHFVLLRAYGPIIISDKEVGANAVGTDMYQYRSKVEDCFDYIINLIDEAIPDLKETTSRTDYGMINQVIAKAIKARILVTRASPFYSGNRNYFEDFLDFDGQPYFDVYATTEQTREKWGKALEAVNEAITACSTVGVEMYHYDGPTYSYDRSFMDTNTVRMKTLYDLRMIVVDPWNKELIWGLSKTENNISHRTNIMLPDRFIDVTEELRTNESYSNNDIGATYHMLELYYTKNGLPITEDKTFFYSSRLNIIQTPGGEDPEYLEYAGYMQPGATTIQLYMEREPRFYANLGLTGGYYRSHEELITTDFLAYIPDVNLSGGGLISEYEQNYIQTGIGIQKMVHPESKSGHSFRVVRYPFPMIRLADLYLLKAEALNEYNGPSQEVYDALNIIRDRAGIPHVETVWSDAALARTVDKHKTQSGLRDIIKQDRSIELAFEGARFWDVVRWNDAIGALSQPVRGWAATKSGYEGFFVQEIKQTRKFSFRDCLWPITTDELNTNANLKQNPGW